MAILKKNEETKRELRTILFTISDHENHAPSERTNKHNVESPERPSITSIPAWRSNDKITSTPLSVPNPQHKEHMETPALVTSTRSPL